jgi:hypothetical protein
MDCYINTTQRDDYIMLFGEITSRRPICDALLAFMGAFLGGKYHTNQLWRPIQMSELDRNSKSKGVGEKCVIKMAHILDILHRVILVERHKSEVVHCRVHWASVETGSPQRQF